MGCNLKDLIIQKEVELDFLKGKTLAVDAFNSLYQYLTTIRQRDGGLLKDSKGNVTSHLTGLFNRTTKLMKLGVNLIYVFDGEPPELKISELERRRAVKIEAHKKFLAAKEKGAEEEMKKYAARTSRLTDEMVDESKKLLKALGLPVVQAKSEGEAQVAYIVNKKEAYAGASEDFDSLIFGIPTLIRNLTISGKRRVKTAYVTIKPKLVKLDETLNHLGIDQDQLIVLGILIGTDYDPGGIRGVGPKNALKLAKEYKQDYDGLFRKVEWNKFFNFSWQDVYYLIKKMPIEKDYSIRFGKIDMDKVYELLVEEHDFSMERVEKQIHDLIKETDKRKQTGLGKWF